MNWQHTLPLFFIVGAVLLVAAVSAQLLISRTMKETFLEEHSNVIAPLLGVVGTLFSVLLGFMVGGAMERYHDAAVCVDMEANAVADVFRLAQGLEDKDRVLMRQLCRRYSNRVSTLEWPEMKRGEETESAWSTYQEMWEATLSMDPYDNQRLSNIQQTIISDLKHLGENRRKRLVISRHGLTHVQWTAINLGAAITVLFCLFFPIRRAVFRTLLTSLVSLSLGLNIWLLAAYSTPFSGELQIQPYMFVYDWQKLMSAPDRAPIFLQIKQSDNKIKPSAESASPATAAKS